MTAGGATAGAHEAAPLFEDVADGPPGGRALWIAAADGLRLRAGHWPAAMASGRGTVLLFTGRTEYIEKYGPTAAAFAHQGLHTLTVDWRGQGLSARMTDDRLSGHVARFVDYQLDVAAMIALAEEMDLPRPWFLLAHSMGGAIGLRALMDGLPVERAAFSAPMWGIGISPTLRPVAWSVAWAAEHLGADHLYAPGTAKSAYPEATAFDANLLTADRERYDWMARQTRLHPDLALGGPSLRWLGEALRDCRDLAPRPSPDIPTLTILGSEEKIVDPAAVQARMTTWPGGALKIAEGGRHEVLMEVPALRETAYGHYSGHFMLGVDSRGT